MGQQSNAGEVRTVTLESERKYGLPEGTLYKMAGIESSFGKNMVSPAGAKGWFGFMDATATEYGLDDPMDLAKSSDAAGRKMRDLSKKHKGNLDYALVDYNGGGNAVRALRDGKPWEESAGYLTKFHKKGLEEITGMPQGAPAQRSAPTSMGEQFTSQTTTPPVGGPSASELTVADRQRDNKFGGVSGVAGNLPRAVSLGFQTQNSVYNFWQDQGMEAAGGDALDWESPAAKQELDKFPDRHWGYLLQSGTTQELARRSGRLAETMDKERELGSMGMGLALTGGIAGSLPDLPTLIGFLPVVGGAGLMTKTSRIANAARLGAMGGATNVAYDAVANQYKPTATADDLYISAAMGIGMGALGGAITNPARIGLREENLRLREFGTTEAATAMRREVADAFPQMPPEVAKRLDELNTGSVRQGPEKRPLAIIESGPDDLPAAPRTAAIAEGAPTLPATTAKAVEAPVANPSGKPWDAKWDTPMTVTRMGADDILMLPPVKRLSEGADYIRTYSKNPDFVALMDRALKGMDLRKLKFQVLDPKMAPEDIKVSGRMYQEMDKGYGITSTPQGSTGGDIEIGLRGYGWGRTENGLNEETFVHELLHAATVYKMRRVASGETAGMRPESVKAVKDLDKLYKTVGEMSRMLPADLLPERFEANMKNSREFVAYGLTNRPFQELLKSLEIDGGKTTLWNRFTNNLRTMLGISKGEANAYSRLIDLSAGLLDKSGIEKTGRPRANYTGDTFIDAEDIVAANAADLPPVFGYGLGLEHKLGSQKVPQAVRNLAGKLFGTTVGYKDHAKVQRSAWDDTIAKAEGWTAENRKAGYTAFNTWFKESGRAYHEKGQAFEDFGEQVSNYVRGFEGDFHPEVRKAGDKLREINGRIVDEINNPAHTEGGAKRGLTEVEMLDDTGQKVLVGKLEKNPNYLARKHDARKWDEAVRTWGREAVEGWWAGAYAKVHPERSAEDSAKWAGWYMRTVEEAHMNRSADHLEEMMTGYDEKALLESLMRNGGFDERSAREIMGGMFQKPSSDAGRTASSLRHRNHISETHSETWKKPDGTSVEVNINDFIQSNALDVSESYFRRTASSIALANRLDVYKQSDIGSLIDKATAKGFGSDVSDAAALKMRTDLKFGFDRVQGIPQEEWSAWNKGFEMWRDFNVIRLMGGAVWNQTTELAQIVGSMGWRATLGAVGELKALRRDIRTGKAPHDFLDHLENTIGGVGSEYVARLDFSPKDDWVRYKGDTAQNRRLDKLDGGLKKVAKGVLDYTGMTGMMVQQKRLHAIALTNHFVNTANGTPSGFLSKDRLAWMGMTEGDHSRLNTAIKAYSKTGAGQYGKKVDFDFKRFAAEKPEENSMLMNALHRESRRVIQENDLASMVPLMGTTLGKTVFQFMNFTMHGWNKSMLFSMNHRDFSTLSSVMHGSLFASLAYMGRTQLAATGMSEEKRKEFLDKRMSSKQIVANSFGKISQASLLPQLYDSTVGNFTGTMFAGSRTTSDLSGIASNPTASAVNGVLSLGKMVRNGMSDELQTTSRDIKTWARLVPLNNVAPVSSFFNALANDYPYSEKSAD
jgi:Transglycosylase SLT domain